MRKKRKGRREREGRLLGRTDWLHVYLARGCHNTAGSVR